MTIAASTSQIPARAPVDIQVPHGDVTVTPSGDDQIHVQAHLVVYAANDRSARRNLDALAPQLVVDGGNVTLRAADVSDGHADLTIEIPNGAVPSVTAGHGDVTLEGLAGPANVNADRGDVKADNITGEVHVRMGKGDFSAHADHGRFVASGAAGRCFHLRRAGQSGAWTATSSGTPTLPTLPPPSIFTPAGPTWKRVMIPGDLSIDSGDLQLNNATGPVRISTSAKDVECSQITGDLRVEDGDGDISLGVVAPLGELRHSQPEWGDQSHRASGRKFPVAGERQEREHRVQTGPVGNECRGKPEPFRAGRQRGTTHCLGVRSRRYCDHRHGRGAGAARAARCPWFSRSTGAACAPWAGSKIAAPSASPQGREQHCATNRAVTKRCLRSPAGTAECQSCPNQLIGRFRCVVLLDEIVPGLGMVKSGQGSGAVQSSFLNSPAPSEFV